MRLVGPLLALTVIAGVSAYAISSHLAHTVLDQWLYDSAISLAKRVHTVDGRITVVIGEQGRTILEWDAVDRVFYEVMDGHGEVLSSNAIIPKPPKLLGDGPDPVFYDANIGGSPVRAVAVPVVIEGHEQVLVKMAETRNKKSALTSHALWISIGVSLLIASLSALLTWRGVASGISSTERAIRRISEQHARAPLHSINLHADMPSEIEPLVTEINSLIAGLDAAHRLNQRFTADAAHQLRTPLAALRVQLDRARRERDPGAHAMAMDEVVEGLDRMTRVVNQLLTLAKAEYAEVAVPTTIDLDQVARDQLERHLNTAAEQGVELWYVEPEGPAHANGHVELVSEAVSNLIDNALQYGASGGKVMVGVRPSGPEIFVEDTGPGIAPTELPKVCDRFYRVPGSTGQGCGLGLSIAKEIARQNSAKLILETGVDGVGLRARLIFERASAEVARV
jgi:two-component system sensor histidine kinase TctE